MNRFDNDHLVGGKQRDRMRPMPVTVSGVSCISCFWLASTFLVLSGLIVAGGFPNWIRNRVEPGTQARTLANTLTRVDLGLFYLCYKLRVCGDNSPECEDQCRAIRACGCYPYMNYEPQAEYNSTNGVLIDSNMRPYQSLTQLSFLFSSSIVYAFGCFLLLSSLLVGAIAFCKPKCGSCSLFLFSFSLQALAGLALIVSLALLPVFFGADFAAQFCGSSADYYIRGQCSLDWSLFLAMVVTACSLYLPALAIFSMNISDGLNARVCC